MDTSLSKPTRIGAYDVVSVIGRGGMGTVFKATDPRIGRSVAIKVLTAAADDPDLLLRFYREAKYTGSLQHQNIVTVYELGHQDGIPYLVMEYLEGVSLETLIASGRPMPMAEKLRIILQVCSGLAYAHKRDLVHRDIKPANIVIVENGTAKIVDFGIARLGGNRLTKTGHVVGSLNYMSPEQLNGNVELDLRTDLYSTGVVLFQLLTGVLPFEGGTTAGTLRKIVQDPPPPLAGYLKDCPAELEAIAQKALAKNREERYSSAEDFAVDIARVQQQYERQMLADYLKQASDCLQRKDFTAARQHVLQVLRVAPQSSEGSDLLRTIKQGQEHQQREQQALQLQMKAEEAFRKNEFSNALQFIEQGLQLDSGGRTVFLTLRDAIFEAQTKMANYREALQRAETGLRSGDLEAAKQAIDDAIQILPDEPECRRLAAQVAARIEQRLREQKTAQTQRQFALTVNAVEKGMADARMLMFLGQIPEALQALEKVATQAAELPPKWGEQLVALRKEILAKQAELQQGRARQEHAQPEEGAEDSPATSAHWRNPHQQTAEMPAPFNATEMMHPEAGPEAPQGGFNHAAEQASLLYAPTDQQESRTATFIRPQPSFTEEKPEIAPEMLEFLQPEKPKWSLRPVILLGLAVAILVVVVLWLFIRPKPQDQASVKPATNAANYTYAEINAEPWATVTDLTPANGDAPSALGAATPLRVKLPAGQYTVTLEGPNHEQKRVQVTVPLQGGAKCFVLFRKPDVNRLLSQK
jgi:serine/threonine protein kinase